MSASAATVATASIKPELFPEQTVRAASRAFVITILFFILLAGFGLRAVHLGAEGFSEDELNKRNAAEQYRAQGLTSANGEHPMLMKGLIAVSLTFAERWNAARFAEANPSLRISTEAAVRLPTVIFGALTSLLIFFVATELFGIQIGLVAASLWAFDPQTIGFNRIAKEDSFLLFFFLLANVFWLRGQRVAEAGGAKPERYYWATAAAFGAMMASKYLPHILAISVSYYYIFQGVPQTRWRLGKARWLIFFAVMGAAFLVFNPTILLPGTWHEMRIFAGEKRIGHDSYEFMGELYRNQMTLWLKGSPWYFYYVFMGVKMPLLTIAAFVIGLPVLFTRRLGDGRYFILFWLFYWFFPFTLLGGKFTRYFTFAVPPVLITAAIGIQTLAHFASRYIANLSANAQKQNYARACIALIVIASSLYASMNIAPYFRLYTNAPGGGMTRAGNFFPHDEFYDGQVRETVARISARARHGAQIASETPELVAYYARQFNRPDIISISLSDVEARRKLAVGDFITLARGRRYRSNDAIVTKLQTTAQCRDLITLGSVPATCLYELDDTTRQLITDVL